MDRTARAFDAVLLPKARIALEEEIHSKGTATSSGKHCDAQQTPRKRLKL